MKTKDFLGLSQDIGRFNKRVSIQAQPTGVNNYNEPTGSWTTVATRWAAIEPTSGREYVRGNQMAAESTHLVELLYYSGLSAVNRLAWTFDGVVLVLEIVSINPSHGLKTFQAVQCKQIEGAT